jgi:hypothetical protein
MTHVHWHTDHEDRSADDVEWYGWTEDPRTSEPRFLVKSPEPDVWAGWVYEDDDVHRNCITLDHASASAAKREIEQLNARS